ncbi:hypothetical protein ACLOJK_011782 [Asimina triloba]
MHPTIVFEHGVCLFVGSIFNKSASSNRHMLLGNKTQGSVVQSSASEHGSRVVCMKTWDNVTLPNRRAAIGLMLAIWGFDLASPVHAKGAGLPPEEKPKLCDDDCVKVLENVPMVTTESGLQYKDIKVGQGPSPPIGFQVAANYVAMVPSGQVFDSSLEKDFDNLSTTMVVVLSDFGTNPQHLELSKRKEKTLVWGIKDTWVIKGLDEGILSMKIGGKRRLYIPGSLAFPKGLTSAPGRPRVAPNSPVIFDVSLEYVPGLEADEERLFDVLGIWLSIDGKDGERLMGGLAHRIFVVWNILNHEVAMTVPIRLAL